LELNGDRVQSFIEKPEGDGGLINGGFFVLNPSVLDLIDGDNCVWESGPVNQLARTGELAAWRHHGFWQAMDTLRDKNALENLWATGGAPWKTWA
jgi:glucose-1-phosphate cytidylyltransferase